MNLKSCIAPSFYGLHKAVKRHKYTHYVLKGGRGSTKSSFVAIEMILSIMRNPKIHGIALRAVGNTLHDSVFEQLLWAIDTLGVGEYFTSTVSPLKITYKPTGQTIIFRGTDDPFKIKSIKAPFGYFGVIWYEEWDQFGGMEQIRNINQSLMRGGSEYTVFYTFNPPQSINNWVNYEVMQSRGDRIVHHSTYETVPHEWLGEQFLIEAEHLRKTNPEKWEHEYGGNATGTGGEVFRNVTVCKISDEEIARFDRIRRGLDWGYAVDPFAYIVCHYDKTRRKLYIFHEIYKAELSNRNAAELIKKENRYNREIVADSAEPKSIADMYEYGLRICPAVKGPDSVKHGIEWLKDLEAIVIDPERCPNATREFTCYELQKDKNGNFKGQYPDKDNHTIDAVRYACEDDSRNVRVR